MYYIPQPARDPYQDEKPPPPPPYLPVTRGRPDPYDEMPPPPPVFDEPPPPPPPLPEVKDAPHYVLLRDDSALSLMPNTEEARLFLTLEHREFVHKIGRPGAYVYHHEPMYKVLERDGKEFLQTYQGLWQDLKEHLEERGRTVTVLDMTLPFPTPNIPAAMHGLTESQQGLMRTALTAGMSGLIGAPTRYGKTYCLGALCKAHNGLKIVVIAPGVDLCAQLVDDLKKIIPDRDIRGIFTGSKHRTQGPDITVCSIDSSEKCDPGSTDLVIVDEPHAMVAKGRLARLAKFYRSRIYGLGATLNGRSDKKDRLITAIIGPVIANKSYLEAVAEKSISPNKVVFIKVPFSIHDVPGKMLPDTAIKHLLFKSAKLARLVKKVCEKCIPRHWQTMLFIKNEQQADYFFNEAMDPTCTVAMAKKLGVKERKEVTRRIAANEVSRILASIIYTQGVTFPDLRVVINLGGGGANTSAIQRPGRLLQRRPKKNYGVMVEFLFECIDSVDEARREPPYGMLVGMCWARHTAYTEIGYDIEIIEGDGAGNRLREIILGAYDPEEP